MVAALRSELYVKRPAPPKRPGPGNGGTSSDAARILLNPALVVAAYHQLIERAVKDKSYLETPLGDDAGAYLLWKQDEDGAAPATIDSYERVVARVCLAVLKPAAEVTVEDLRECRGTFTSGQRRKFTAVVKDWFRWLYEEGHLDHNPAGRLRYPKKVQAALTDLYTDEEKAALAAQEDPMDKAGVLLLLRAGVRKTELANMQVRDVSLSVDPADCFVLVRRGKGGKARRVPVKGELTRALYALLAASVPGYDRPRRADEYLLCPTIGGRSQKRDPSRPMGSRGQHEWWYRCLERAGLVDEGVTRGRRMHAARHTYATDLGRATGWNLVAVQKNLGHANIGTTVDTYTQFAFEDQAEAVLALPEIEELAS